ncbi:hypothetical protein MKW94_000339, partial [Papaver nudicaule]|nr:hypothetical protein [Papaver nudicaule]
MNKGNFIFLLNPMNSLYARVIEVLDAGGEASRKLLKEELPEILVEENANQNDEAKAKVIDEDDGLRFNCEEIELFARIIQVLDTGDEASRKSMKEELLKILEKENSKQNDETEAKMIDRNGGLAVDKAKVDSSKETEEEKSKQNDETKDIFRVFKRSRSGCLDDF